MIQEAIKKIEEMAARELAPIDVGGIKAVVAPAGYVVHSLEKFQHTDYAERPHRIKANVEVRDSGSFVQYWSNFADESSRVFANRDASQFIAVLDYHEGGAGTQSEPRWCQHRAILQLRYTEEWQIWTGGNGKRMTQTDMATFIEDNAPDVVKPSAAEMMECALSLRAKSEVQFDSVTRLQNGSIQMKYVEEVKGTFGSGNVSIPESFTIAIPVYEGMAPVEIQARLRYQLTSGKVALWYSLLRAHAAEREAFLTVAAQIRGECGTLFNGKP